MAWETKEGEQFPRWGSWPQDQTRMQSWKQRCQKAENHINKDTRQTHCDLQYIILQKKTSQTRPDISHSILDGGGYVCMEKSCRFIQQPLTTFVWYREWHVRFCCEVCKEYTVEFKRYDLFYTISTWEKRNDESNNDKAELYRREGSTWEFCMY